MNPRRQVIGWAIGLLVLLAAFGLQTQLYTGQVRTVSTVFMYVGLAAAWNLIGGYTGYACFGQVGFFGLGAYTTVVFMTHLGVSFWLTIVVAAVVAGLFAALVGFPLLRLKGHYFAVATLGVAEGLREVVINTSSLTGGGAGITIPSFGDAVTPWLGNAYGALLGGLVLGLFQAWGGQLLPGTLVNAIAFGVLVVVLALRPQGLAGRAFYASRVEI